VAVGAVASDANATTSLTSRDEIDDDDCDHDDNNEKILHRRLLLINKAMIILVQTFDN